MTPFAKLKGLTHCPVCCGRLTHAHESAGEHHQSLRLAFACGGMLASYGGSEIEIMTPCPAPSAVAVDALNEEAAAMRKGAAA